MTSHQKVGVLLSPNSFKGKQTYLPTLRERSKKIVSAGAWGAVGGLIGAYGIHAIRKQIDTIVRRNITYGERLDFIIVQGFLTSARHSIITIKAMTAKQDTESTLKSTTDAEDALLLKLTTVHTGKNRWKLIAKHVSLSARQCAMRWEELDPISAIDADMNRFHSFCQTQRTFTQSRSFFGTLIKRTFRRLYYQASLHQNPIHEHIGLLAKLIVRISPEYVLDFLKGGHAIIHDAGKFYVNLITTPDSHPRMSSHYPQFKNAPHYGLTIRIPQLPVIHILTGIVRRQHQRVTWVQLESSPMPSLVRLLRHEGLFRNVEGLVRHGIDYLSHLRTRKQYGPLGASNYTEKGKMAQVINIK